MSFASETKKELTGIQTDDCCKQSELSALIRMNGSLSFSNRLYVLDVQTENAAIARRIYTLIKNLYNIPVELLVRKKMRLKKNNIYIVRMNEGAKNVLTELGILEEPFTFKREISEQYLQNECCKKSYLRGAFLAGGSVNNPETSSYHLEIFTLYEEHNEAIVDLMNDFTLHAKTHERKKGFITYLKEAEKITEFLILIGAHQALLKFEDVRIMRDMRNSVNRLVNCETANLNKTIGAAFRQVENIRYIDAVVGIESLPEKLREAAELRMKHQEVSLKELVDLAESGTISKSGLNHRFRKIDEYAEKLRKGELLEK
ncbi:DNA-binding protein WhiA [Alkalibacillus haloalkaliphilus]|uniref:Probable cell division protein WhiA n=1 Tax=Alkalibacillus haloalkaliphilus TaxID=94136 RepID=A0A511W9K1_9BACI|nr:DNA-binding protein WhiA [Alkalibacillus haloalkaliphilus]GEN46763.1 putative sporulation transcription regulator WhiA [Alkalibacillus haloalkaliphilus]